MRLIPLVDRLGITLDRSCMAENQNSLPAGIPDLVAKLNEMGPDFTLGLDTNREWATGIQAFPNPDFTLFVFREQTYLPMADEKFHLSIKNVASIVVPTRSVREFCDNLKQSLDALDALIASQVANG